MIKKPLTVHLHFHTNLFLDLKNGFFHPSEKAIELLERDVLRRLETERFEKMVPLDWQALGEGERREGRVVCKVKAFRNER